MMMSKNQRPMRRFLLPVAVVALFCAPSSMEAQYPPTAPLPSWGPVSINLEEIEYPFPVKYLPLTLYGEEVRLAYMDESPAGAPKGRTVVLLHGMNFFGEYWGGTMRALLDRGFRVIAIDQIGFGRSSKPLIPYTLGDATLNIRALLDELGIARAAIVGHSMGGIMATRFAFFYPDVATHLVLVNQIGMTDGRLDRPWRRTEEVYASNLQRSYDAVRANFVRYYVRWHPASEEYIRIHYGWTLSADWPRLAMIRSSIQQMMFAEPIVHDWPHIRSRTLVIGGTEDGPSYPELARRVAETIPGARLHLIPEVGHNPHLEAPDRFLPALIEFLES